MTRTEMVEALAVALREAKAALLSANYMKAHGILDRAIRLSTTPTSGD
jgi:hypothetical protein